MNDDIRWKQRFSNYKKALSHLTPIVEYAKTEEALAQTLAYNIVNIYHAELIAFEQTMERLQ